MTRTKTHREPLPEELTKALLTTGGIPLAKVLEEARETFQKAIQDAREHLSLNPLTPIVAESVTKGLGRRGDATVVIDNNGTVMLEIQYGCNGNTRQWRSDLPTIAELRHQASDKKVDISHLGRNRRKIVEFLKTS